MSFKFVSDDFVPDNGVDYAIVSQYGYDLYKAIICNALSKEEYLANKSMFVASYPIDITENDEIQIDMFDDYCVVDIDQFRHMVNYFKEMECLRISLHDERLKEFNVGFSLGCLVNF